MSEVYSKYEQQRLAWMEEAYRRIKKEVDNLGGTDIKVSQEFIAVGTLSHVIVAFVPPGYTFQIQMRGNPLQILEFLENPFTKSAWKEVGDA